MIDPALPGSNVYLVDNDAVSRLRLERLLGGEGYLVRSFDNTASLHADLGEDAKGCALIEVRLPGMDGLELQQWLSTHSPAVAVVFMTAFGDMEAAVRAMKHGAVDFLIKPIPPGILLPIVREASRQSAEIAARRQAELQVSQMMARLTRREREVVGQVVAGRLNKQIAAALGISEKTVKVHRGRAMAKMGARNLPDLVRRCEGLGIDHGRRPESTPRSSNEYGRAEP